MAKISRVVPGVMFADRQRDRQTDRLTHRQKHKYLLITDHIFVTVPAGEVTNKLISKTTELNNRDYIVRMLFKYAYYDTI